MQFKTIGAFVVGFVLCAGVMSGGSAMAKVQKKAAHKQVSVKLEWITTTSTGARTVETLVLLADAGQEATSRNESEREGTIARHEASVMAKINPDGTATLNLNCDVVKQGKEPGSATCRTTLTVVSEETRVVRGFVRKTGNENSDTILLVTTVVQ